MRTLTTAALLTVLLTAIAITFPNATLADATHGLAIAEVATAEETAEEAATDESADESENADDESTAAGSSDEDSDEDGEATDAETTGDTDESADKDESAEKKAAKKRKTHTVEAKRFKVDATLDGTFTAREMTEVALRPESWSRYEIVEIVLHGSEVHEGQVLVKFDSRDLDEAIAELELEQRLREISIIRAEEELPRMEKLLAMNLAEAQRDHKNAKIDYDRYHEINRPLIVKQAEYSLKSAKYSLDYVQDELDQLEKMYEADDLTEETEEIVLKRTRNQVDFAKFNVEYAQRRRDELLDIRLPRQDIRIKESLDRASLQLAEAKTASSLNLNRARYELEQLKQSRAQSLDKHTELLADRDLMELKSPADGTAYYGECEDGKWSNFSSLMSKLKPYNRVSADTVLMTIVQPRPLVVTASLEEELRPDGEVGQPAKIATPSERTERIAGRVSSISVAPTSNGKFTAECEMTGDVPGWVVAGLSCKVDINTYDEENSLTVPKKALQTDEFNKDENFVWVVDPDDHEAKAERRTVKVGRRSGDDVEIVDGLEDGDVVSLEDEKKREEKQEEGD